jgi:hypothetical protein
MFHLDTGQETNLCATKPFSAFGAELRKPRMVIKLATTTADSVGSGNGRQSMRTLNFVLGFVFLLARPSMADLSDNSLPGVGTFAYSGSPIVTSAPEAVVVAAR